MFFIKNLCWFIQIYIQGFSKPNFFGLRPNFCLNFSFILTQNSQRFLLAGNSNLNNCEKIYFSQYDFQIKGWNIRV